MIRNDVVLTYIFVEQNQRKMNYNNTGSKSWASQTTIFIASIIFLTIIGIAVYYGNK